MSIKRARMHRVFFNDDIYTKYEDQKAKKTHENIKDSIFITDIRL